MFEDFPISSYLTKTVDTKLEGLSQYKHHLLDGQYEELQKAARKFNFHLLECKEFYDSAKQGSWKRRDAFLRLINFGKHLIA